MNIDMFNNRELNKKNKDMDKNCKWLMFIIFLVFLITKLPNFFSFVNRDAGSFAYIGEQILEGKILYKDIWSSKPPGVYYLNAFIFCFLPKTFLSLRIFELIYCLITSFVVYKLALFFYSKKTSLIVTAIYSLFSNMYSISEAGMMTETYMLLPMVLAIYFFILFRKKQEKKYLVLVGLMSGLSFMFKQPGLSSLAGIFVFLMTECFLNKGHFKKISIQFLLISIGVGVIIVTGTLYFILKQGMTNLISDVFIYNYWRSKAYGIGIFSLAKKILYHCFLAVPLRGLFILTILLCLLFFWRNFILKKRRKKENEIINIPYFLVLIFWLIFDLLGVYIGGAFYAHYWIQIIPSFSLIVGYMIERVFVYPKTFQSVKIKNMFICVLICSFLFSIGVQMIYCFNIFKKRIILKEKTVQEMTAQWLIKNSRDNDSIYVWGDECAISFLSKRKIPSRYIHLYPLYTANHATEKKITEFINDLKQNPPKYIIDTSITNWMMPLLWKYNLRKNYVNKRIPKAINKLYELKWVVPIMHFIQDNYVLEQAIGGKYAILVLK